MIRSSIPLVVVSLALAACSQEPGASGNVTVANEAVANIAAPESFAARVRALPEGQRNGVFLRAVRDSDNGCQEVTEAYETLPANGHDVWAVTCDGTGHYVIAFGATDDASVTKVSAASRLPRRSSQAPAS